jgi:hypothetical protein
MRDTGGVRFLQQLPGIGPWSAALILLRGYLYYCARAQSLLDRGLIAAESGPETPRPGAFVS